MKNHIAANMESLAYSTSKYVDELKLEDFHESLHAYTDIFTNNILKLKMKQLIIRKNSL